MFELWDLKFCLIFPQGHCGRYILTLLCTFISEIFTKEFWREIQIDALHLLSLWYLLFGIRLHKEAPVTSHIHDLYLYHLVNAQQYTQYVL